MSLSEMDKRTQDKLRKVSTFLMDEECDGRPVPTDLQWLADLPANELKPEQIDRLFAWFDATAPGDY